MEEDSGPLAPRKGAAIAKQTDGDGQCSVCAQAIIIPGPPTASWPTSVGRSVMAVSALPSWPSQEGKW